MHRRALLVGLGSALTGCMETPDGRPTPTKLSPSSPEPNSELRIADLSVTTSTDQPDSRYVLKTVAFYSADAVERERASSDEPVVVRDVSSIDDPNVRSVIEQALRTDQWRGDSIPEGLSEVVDEVDFFTGVPSGETHTHVGLKLYRLDPDRPPALEFDATVSDEWVAEADPAALEYRLVNTGQETQEIFSGTVPPFGLVRAERSDGSGSILLWRDYEEEGCVSFTDRGVVVCGIGVKIPIEPDDSISRRYEVLPSTTSLHPDHTAPPGVGWYRWRDNLSYTPGHMEPGSTISMETAFELRRP